MKSIIKVALAVSIVGFSIVELFSESPNYVYLLTVGLFSICFLTSLLSKDKKDKPNLDANSTVDPDREYPDTRG